MTIHESVVPDMDEDAYRADPALSSTGARRVLSSPARFRWEQTHPVVKDEFDVGKAAHAKVLGVGTRVVEIPAALLASNGAASTAAAKEFIAQARADGLVPLKADVVAQVDAMAEAVLAHPIARSIFQGDGEPEVSLFATDPATDVPLKARPDWLPPASGRRTIIADLKTADDASRNGFTRAVARHGYDIQDAWYRRVLTLARGDESTAFVFVVVEKDPPHLVAVHQLDDEFEAIGTARMRRAIDTYAGCLAADDWPGYPTEVQIVSAPRWLAIQEEDEAL